MNPIFNPIRKTVALLAFVCFGLCAAFAQGNNPPTWVFARAYAGWNIVGQQASTYTFNGGVCYYSPLNNGQTPPIFVFSGLQGTTTVYQPVFIQDANPALSEIVTPTSTTNGSGSCGFAATTANSHTSFNLLSGTAGLQEAITYQLQSTPIFNVILDKYWYQLVSGLNNGTAALTTPQSIIGSVTGTANVAIVDTTTSPWQWYEWNGSKYVAQSTTGGVEFTSVTQVSAPTALTTATPGTGYITTSSTGGTIGNAGSTYRLAATCVTALGGETTISTDSASTSTIATGTSTSTNSITVTSPAGCTAANGAVGWRLYMSAASGAAGSEILYAPTCSTTTGIPVQIVLNGVCPIGASATIGAVITGTATIPAINSAFVPASGSTSPLTSFVAYPPFPSLSSISAGTAATVGLVNFAPGFLNTLGRHLHLHGTLYGSTNSTPGTLTTAVTLASVPGVTSITPFTAVNTTNTTASAVVNGVFDVDITTTATGSSGTVESHGTVCYNLAGTSAATCYQDLIIAASSTIDLTKQNQLAITLKPTTTATTTSGLRQLTVQVLQ